MTIIKNLESTSVNKYTNQTIDTEAVKSARTLAFSVNNRLPEWAKKGWRWEILYLRAILDYERFVGRITSSTARGALQRLIEIYNCPGEIEDPYHNRVHPPLPQAESGSKKY